MIAAHDHRDFEIFCYSDAAIVDAATERLRADGRSLARNPFPDRRGTGRDHSRRRDRYSGRSDRAYRRQPVADVRPQAGPDSGHVPRLSKHDRHVGHGLSPDRRLGRSAGTDRHYYTEQLVRLPRAFFCYRPSEAPEVTPLPALDAGHVTFGSFNNFAKVSPATLEAWLNILDRVAGSRLMILAHGGGALAARVWQSWPNAAASIRRGSSFAKSARGRHTCSSCPRWISRWIRFRSTGTRRRATRCGWACRS